MYPLLTSRKAKWVGLLILVLILILTINTLTVTATSVHTPLMQATPVASPQPTDPGLPAEYPFRSVVIVIIVLVLLFCVFALMFWWAQKMDQASYLGTLFRATIQEIEFKRLKSDLTEKREKLEYHLEAMTKSEWVKKTPQPEPSPELEDEEELTSRLLTGYTPASEVSRLVAERLQSLGYMNDYKYKDTERNDPNAPHNKKIAALRNFGKKTAKWMNQLNVEAEGLYAKDLDKIRKDANERARQAIDFDTSVLRGRGPEFVLQFSTVVIIIFTVVILAVLSIIDSQTISTLLAAIIGYVLGQSASRARGDATESTSGNTEVQIDTSVQKPSG